MKVADILRAKGADVTSIAQSVSAREAARILRQKNIGALIVGDPSEKPLGLLTERDLVHHLAERGPDVTDLAVSSLLEGPMRTCRAEDSVRDVMESMTRFRVRHLPVVDEFGRVTGIVSIGDVIKYRLNEIETEKNVLRDIVTASK
jgi:CBS domain-containing protein